MTFDYEATRKAILNGAKHIGRATTKNQACRLMSPEQVQRCQGVNFMTDEIWQYRSLADGALIAEISYSYFMNAPLFGLTIWCVGPLAADAPEWDHSLSASFHDQSELLMRLHELNTGALDRLQALHNLA